MPFKKGQIANPKGRGRNAASVVDEIDKVLFGKGKNKRSLLHDIIVRQASIAAYAERDSDSMAAAEKLFTRRWGAPKQTLDIDGEIRHVEMARAHLDALRAYVTIDDDGNNVTNGTENIAMIEGPCNEQGIYEENQ